MTQSAKALFRATKAKPVTDDRKTVPMDMPHMRRGWSGPSEFRFMDRTDNRQAVLL